MKQKTIQRLLTACGLFTLAACGSMPGTTATPAPSATPDMPAMQIRYLGHSSFILIAGDGTRIVTDPYSTYPEFLSFPRDVEANLVTISHMHADHTASGNVGGQPVIVIKTGETTAGAVKVTGFPSLHGEYQGSMAPNVIFVFEYRGVKVVHLGELGAIESDAVYNAISDADVVFLPIGVYGGMPYDQMLALLTRIRARTVIPQHFSLSADQRWYKQGTVDEFLATLPDGWPVVNLDELDISPGMPQQIVLLKNLGLK